MGCLPEFTMLRADNAYLLLILSIFDSRIVIFVAMNLTGLLDKRVRIRAI
jgi:hypothetical protein